jgi:hypothetical protein
MILIERWLKGKRNFIVGRVLYERFGKDKALKVLFIKGETAFAKERLIKSLQELFDSGKCVASRAANEVYNSMPKPTDDIFLAIDNEWKPKYQRMNLLRHKLDQFGEDNSEDARAKCKEICREILDLEQQCNVSWEKRNHYEEHGHLPEVKDEEFKIPKDPVELANMISNLKKYIRRHKKNFRDHPDKPVYAALVKKYEDQLKQINDKLCKQSS